MEQNKRLFRIFLFLLLISGVGLSETFKFTKSIESETTLLGCGTRAGGSETETKYICQYAGGGFDKVMDVTVIEYNAKKDHAGEKFGVTLNNPNYDLFIFNMVMLMVGLIGSMISYYKCGAEENETD